MTTKRTPAQIDFDMALHGIAFCDSKMARSKMVRASEALTRCGEDEQRRKRLDYWREVYQ